MKLRLIFTLFLSSVAFSQAKTPNLDMAPDALNWGPAVSTDFPITDDDLGVVQAQGFDGSSSANGVLNPVDCSLAHPPTWCAGSDIGAWTNAAIAALPGKCGEIYMPAGSYIQTSTIVLPRCAKVHGASGYGTILCYRRAGWAVIIADGFGAGLYPTGALEDLTLEGPGAGTPSGGIYIGGSDGSARSPSPSIDPADNYGDFVNINRVRIGGNDLGFGVGVQWGNNAWSTTIYESAIVGNGTGVYFPSTTSDSGERIIIASSAIQNSTGIGVKLANNNAVDLHLTDDSLDYNGSGCKPLYNCSTGWAIQNGNTSGTNYVAMKGGHIEQYAQFVQNYGQLTMDGVDFVNGTQACVLGWVIDNEYAGMNIIGGFIHYSFSNGTCSHAVINNPSGIGINYIGAVTNGTLNNGVMVLDRFGNDMLTSAYIRTLNQTAAAQYAGTSACSSGTEAITPPIAYIHQPAILVFDETTKGGASLSAKGACPGSSCGSFTVSCSGVNDVFDWIVIGNPN
jgi:hypothetical protein